MIIIKMNTPYTCGLFISTITWIDNNNYNSENISNDKDKDNDNDNGKIKRKSRFRMPALPTYICLRCNDTPRLNPPPIVVVLSFNHLRHNLNT